MKILEPKYGKNFLGREGDIEDFQQKIRNNEIVVLKGNRGIGKTNLMLVLNEKFKSEGKNCHFINGTLFLRQVEDIFKSPWLSKITGFSLPFTGGGISKNHEKPFILGQMQKSKEVFIFIENAHELDKVAIELIYESTSQNNLLRFILEIPTINMKDMKLRAGSYTVINIGELDYKSTLKLIKDTEPNFSDEIVKSIANLSRGYPYIARVLIYICSNKKNEEMMLNFLSTLKDDDKYILNQIHKEVLETLQEDAQKVIKKLALAPQILTLKIVEAFCCEDNDTPLSDIINRGILRSENELFWIYHPLFRDFLRSSEIQPMAIRIKKKLYRKVIKNIKSEYDSIYLLLEVINEPSIFRELIKIVKNCDAINTVIIQCITWGELELAFLACSNLKKSTDKKWESNAISSMGAIYQIKGELDKALEHYKKSLDLDKKQGRKNGIASDYGNIGNIYRFQGELAKALEYYEKSLILNEDLMRNKGIAIQLQNMGNVYYLQGEYKKGLNHFERALEFNEKLDNLEGIAANYGSMGNVFFSKGEYEKALEHYEIALKMNEELRIKDGIAIQFAGMGNVYMMKGELDKALQYLKKALLLDEELGDKKGVAVQYGNIGLIYQKKGELDKALEYYEIALNIFKEYRGKIEISRTLVKIGNIFVDKGEMEKALDYYFDAQELADYSPPLLEEINRSINKLLKID